MRLSLHRFGSLAIRIAICLLLLVSNAQGMVLCIGADGKAELKPAIHHHKDKSHTCSHTCGLHHPIHDNSKSQKENSTTTKIKSLSSSVQHCTDIPLTVGCIDTNSHNLSMPITAWVTPDSTYHNADCLTRIEIKFTRLFSDFSDNSLGILRTVILLT